MSNNRLAGETHTSGSVGPKEGDTISDSRGSDTSGDAGEETSAEPAREPGGETSRPEAAQFDESGLTIDEACAMIHCSREWLRKKIHSGEIAAYRVGTGLRVTRSAISQVAPPEQPRGDLS
jgi:excisionase family DNA binding protein